MRYGISIVLSVLLILMLAGTAMATWPSGSQGDQYAAANAAMENAAAVAGISTDTFIDIYNNAIVGNLSGYTDSQLSAACSVLGSLSSYTSVLADYNTVYSNLGCSSRLSATTTRGELPSTGIAIAILLGSGALGIGAATRLLRRNK